MDLERKLNGGRRVNPSLTDIEQPVCNYSSKWGITWESTSPPTHKCISKLLVGGRLGPDGDVCIIPCPPEAQPSLWQREQDKCKSQRQCMNTRKLLSGHSREVAHMNEFTAVEIALLKTCASSSQIRSQHEERRGMKSPPS